MKKRITALTVLVLLSTQFLSPLVAYANDSEELVSETLKLENKAKSNIAGLIKVRYINQAGLELKSESLAGKVGETGTLTLPTGGVFDNYTVVPGQDLDYCFIATQQTITVNYQGNPAEPVIEKHIGTDGTFFGSDSIEGCYGDSYEIEPLTNTEGYLFNKSSESLKGVFGNKGKTITLYYKKVKVEKTTLTVKYLLQGTNKQLSTATKVTDDVGKSIELSAKAVKGYTVVDNLTTRTVTLSSGAKEEIFYYTKDKAIGGAITVRFVDEKGTAINGVYSILINGRLEDTALIGDDYQAILERLSNASNQGYSERISEPDLKAVRVTANKQTLVYVLGKKAPPIQGGTVEIRFVNQSGDVIHEPKRLTGYIDSGVLANNLLPEIDSKYELVANGVYESLAAAKFSGSPQTYTLTYGLNQQKYPESREVTMHCVDVTGKKLESYSAIVSKGEGSYRFNAPYIDDYTLTGTVASIAVDWESGKETVYFMYKNKGFNY